MKLDNIIYDTDTLATAIAEQWNSESESFKAMYPSDTATSLVNVFAGYGSMLQYMLLGAVANCYTTTAFSEAGIYQLADTLGNNLHGNISSQVTVSISKNNFTGIQTIIPAKTQFLINNKKFFNPSAIIIPATSSAVDEIVLVQGEILTVTQTTSGKANEKFYFSTDFKANHNYVTVYVNGVEWDVATSFLDYDKDYVIDVSALNVVVLKTDPDGRSCIKVGDNQLGALPSAESNIQIDYVSNEGSDGNITEIGLTGSLVTPLRYTDNDGTSADISLNIITTSTAYGGSNVQSIDVLRYTSPYVFASGHRAIRRQDYIALLQNECGYLTSNVWGEYEEASKVGAYDALMMNMVYYTGVKSFQEYPSFAVGSLYESSTFGGTLNSTSGFWGSFALTIDNNKNTSAYTTIQDTGAQGILFFNNNADDPRDSMLPLWAETEQTLYIANLAEIGEGKPEGIVSAGSGYAVNDLLVLKQNGNTTPYTVIVTEISTTGAVLEIELSEDESTIEYESSTSFTTEYASGTSGSGTGLIVKLDITSKILSELITTNDETDEVGAIDLNPIANARSDKSKSLYYMSQHEPTLQNPVQIKINFNALDTKKAIVGIKFRAALASLGPFIGTMAMFATNSADAFENDTTNIRNSKNWTKIIERTTLDNPQGNTDNDSWTDWIATNVFSGETSGNEPVFEEYTYYIIEIYSLSDSESTDINLLVFNKIKFLFSDQASLIYYDDNSKITLNFPEVGDPGPDGSVATATGEHTTITSNLINTETLPLWSYSTTLTGITLDNDYRDDNLLAYIYTDPDSQVSTPFMINVVNADTGVYEVSINGDTSLTGLYKITTDGSVSLDNNLVYEEHIENIPSGGTDYTVNDILTIKTNTTDTAELKVRVTSVAAGAVTGVTWILDNYEKMYTISKAFVGTFDTSNNTNAGATGCTITLSANTCSGISTPIEITTAGSGYAVGNNVEVDTALTVYQGTVCKVDSTTAVQGLRLEHSSNPTTTGSGTGLVVTALNKIGKGGKITITTSNNLTLSASFTGNRMDTSTINLFDQPIIKKYNHFTTYLEFKQPSIKQEGITVQVSLEKNTSITSGVILQNVKNSLYSLFDIKSDYIGKGLKLSTIYTTVMAVDGVEWCKVVRPVNNIETAIDELLVPSTIKVIDVTEE